MISEELLRKFCSKDESRSALNNPFNIGDYTYATNEFMAIRIPRDEKYSNNPAAQIGAINFDFSISDDLYVDIPELIDIETDVICKVCSGTKKQECPDCEGGGTIGFESDSGIEYEVDCKLCHQTGFVDEECEFCGGKGTEKEPKNIELGTKLFNGSFLLILKQLPECKIAPDVVASMAAVPFKFNGGCGVIMPLRKF